MYKKVDTNLNFLDREKEIIKFWEENSIFEESIKKNEKGGCEYKHTSSRFYKIKKGKK